ncbi:DUF6227 family protein [Streptomyces sp. 4N509B]|uniref:DUF6227 family protein n=1 Tax=Streptomyces sp. 4N509B TaxID=3457413 RepID=UPI003FD29CD5
MSEQPGEGPERAVPSVEELELLFAGGVAERRRGGPVGSGRWPGGRPEYPGVDAWEHARRLLRRSVNPDRPGEETLRRLAEATAYDIERLPEPSGPLGCGGWCAIYEHAFLLRDGSETCLYEVEHDLTPGGHLVSEVYADEIAAGHAARFHTHALGGT